MINKMLDEDEVLDCITCPHKIKCYRIISTKIQSMLQINLDFIESSRVQVIHRERNVSLFLREINVPANLSGYKYLNTSIILVLENPEYLKNVSKLLYPEVVRINRTTASRVEKNIRVAINRTCAQKSVESIHPMFRLNKKLSNIEFISAVVEYLRFR